MITKYKLFENINVRYIADNGVDCPVCGNEYNTEDIGFLSCPYCDFEWKEQYYNEFVGCDNNGVDIINGKNYESNKKYKSNGETSCPYCNSIDYDRIGDRLENGYLFVDMKCDYCDSIWTKDYMIKISRITDMNNKQIKKGDIVDLSLFNVSKYKKIKAKKFNL